MIKTFNLKKWNRNLGFFILLSMIHIAARAQNPKSTDASNYSRLVDFLPPAPNSASLGAYSNVKNNLATGATNVTIPLYEIVIAKSKIPISLFYSSNGIKVDEIGSSIGMSWVINAGGVITRTVYGSVDEDSKRITVPSDFPKKTRNLVNFMEASGASGNDSQPDVFSFNFNGYSGQFILGEDLNPILLSNNGLRIERNFNSKDWNFKILTEDGAQYFFGGDLAKEITSNSQNGAGCGRIYPNFPVTAWYLTKIIYSNNESVEFQYISAGYNYATGVSQTIYESLQNQTYSFSRRPVLSNTTCLSKCQTNTRYVQKIIFNGASILFGYIDRADKNGKLLDNVEIFQPNQTNLIKSFKLSYNNTYAEQYLNEFSNTDTTLKYRSFLSKVEENSSTGVEKKIYRLEYNNFNMLPPRLTYAQDFYGYFNGKNNNTFIPQSDLWQGKLSQASADRKPDSYFTPFGLLNKITYPTGGSDSLVYENNQVYGALPQAEKFSYLYATSEGSEDYGQKTTFSNVSNIPFRQNVSIVASCSSNPKYASQADPIHDSGTVSIINVETGAVLYSKVLKVGASTNEKLTLDAGNYRLRLTVRGLPARIYGKVDYSLGKEPIQYANNTTGGARILKIITNSGLTSNVKKYFYNTLANPSISSAMPMYTPRYENFLSMYVLPSSNSSDPAGTVYCDFDEYNWYSMYSNSLNNIYSFPNSINYKSVIESFGENFENGGIEHHYNIKQSTQGNQLLGNPIPSAPLTSYSYENAQEIYTFLFKYTNGVYTPVQKKYVSYKQDQRVANDFKAYLVSKKYNPVCIIDPPNDSEINAYDLYSYSILKQWIYVDTVRTQTFDATGNNYVENIVVNEYANPEHAQLTKTISNTSDLQSESSVYYYPQDVNLSGDEESARVELINKHILNPVLNTKTYKNSNLFQNVSISYHTFPNGLTLPRNYSLSVYSNPEEPRVQFDNYDKTGNLLQQSVVNGAKTSYLWSYNGQHPIAEIRNADYATVEAILGSTTVADIAAANPTDSEITSWINQLRNSTSLKDAHITSYTYKPLVGMTSMTDPKGMTTYYEYDEFQRLKNMKDQNGNILKNTTYHYKN